MATSSMVNKQTGKSAAKAAGKPQKMNQQTALEVELELVKSQKVHVTKAGLTYDEKQTVTIAEWQETGRELIALSQLSIFCLGDWMNYGMGKFPKDYEKAVETTGMKVGTLRNIASIAKKFPADKRRVGLSFEHHRLVGPLEPAKQDEILDRAEKEGLTAAAVNALVPRKKRHEKAPKKEEINSECLSKRATLVAYVQGEGIDAPVNGFYKTWGSTTDPRSPMGELALALANYEEEYAKWFRRAEAEANTVADETKQEDEQIKYEGTDETKPQTKGKGKGKGKDKGPF